MDKLQNQEILKRLLSMEVMEIGDSRIELLPKYKVLSDKHIQHFIELEEKVQKGIPRNSKLKSALLQYLHVSIK